MIRHMEELLRSHLSACAAVLAVHGISREAIGQAALKDDTFFRRVIDGRRGFTVRTYDRVMTWIAANWPAAEWPAHVPDRAIWLPKQAVE